VQETSDFNERKCQNLGLIFSLCKWEKSS